MSIFGPPNIEKLKAQGNVMGLIKALDYKQDANIRKEAAIALGQIGGTSAVQALINSLKDDSIDVAQAAIKSLGKIRDPQAVKPLIDTMYIMRLHKVSAEALLMFGSPAIEPLVERINYLVRSAPYGTCKDYIALLAQIGTPAVNALITMLNHKENLVRSCAADGLGQIGDSRAVEPLIAMLVNETDGVKGAAIRGAAARALAKIGDEKAIPPLVAALRYENERHRLHPQMSAQSAVINALDNLGWQPDNSESAAIYWAAKGQWEKCIDYGPLAVEPLIVELCDKNKRSKAISILTTIKPPPVKELITTLESDGLRRGGAAEALGWIGDERAVPALINQLKLLEDKYAVPALQDKTTIEKTIVKIGSPGLPYLSAALNKKTTPHMQRTLQKLIDRIQIKDA